MNTIIQLLSAFVGSLGFCLLFHVSMKYIFSSALGGFLCWGVYLVSTGLFDGIFFSSLLTSAFCALYSEISARVFRAPATVFYIPAIIPLIPGSTLYYTMSHLVQEDITAAQEYATATAQYALGIACGSCLIWAVSDIFRNMEISVKRRR